MAATPGPPPPVYPPVATDTEAPARHRRVRLRPEIAPSWVWTAIHSSPLALVGGAVLVSLGMSVRQSLLAVLIGCATCILPIGIGTLAGHRAGRPALLVSRAWFGRVGNAVPALITTIARLAWTAALACLLAGALASAIGSPGSAPMVGAAAVALASGCAAAGPRALAWLGRIAVAPALLAVVATVWATRSRVDPTAALMVGDGPWVLVAAGAVLVASTVGFLWATAAGDLAGTRGGDGPGAPGAPDRRGSGAALATIGATLPVIVITGWGILLAAGSPTLSGGLVADPVGTVLGLLPGYLVPVVVTATTLSLVTAIAVGVQSTALGLRALDVPGRHAVRATGAGVAALALGAALTPVIGGSPDALRDLVTTLAVPTAAWTGITAAELALRRRRIHGTSLEAPGIYPLVSWGTLAWFGFAIVAGYGLTTAQAPWLTGQGYLFAVVGIPLDGDLASADPGMLLALLVGLLTPLLAGTRAIRHQEAAAPPR